MTVSTHTMQAAVLALLFGTLAGTAYAQAAAPDDGSYIGLGAGALRSPDMQHDAINAALRAQGLDLRTTRVEDHDTGWKLYAGQRLGRHLAVEGGYTALGRYRYEGQVVQDPGTVQATYKAGSWNLAALAILPLVGAAEAYGKAGFGYWQTRLDVQGSFSGSSAQPARAHGTGPLWGLGASWRSSGTLSVRIEWERFGHIGQADRTGRADIDFASVSLQHHF